jgi:uncharacterized membrane protein
MARLLRGGRFAGAEKSHPSNGLCDPPADGRARLKPRRPIRWPTEAPGMMRYVKIITKWLFAVLFIAAGVNHFLNEPFYLRIMPDYIPQSLHRPAVIVSGAFEVLLGVLLVIPPTTRLAAWGIIALLIAVFPANIYAFQHSEEIFDISKSQHFIRLPLQGVMIAWAYWYTRPERAVSPQRSSAG